MPDPKLVAAMEEIKAVLKKHDVGAVVVLSSPTHMEFLREYAPTWSCVTVEQHPGGHALRIRAHLADFESPQARKKCLEDSIGMLAGFADALTEEKEQLLVMLKVIGEQIGFDHITKDEGPHD
jgi:hypothetical protein